MTIVAKLKTIFQSPNPIATSAPVDPSPISTQQIEWVQSTWRQVEPIANQAAALFYGKLFELDPSLKALFNTDMNDQGKKLMEILTVAVHGLNHLDTLVPAVQALGERHVGYGVETHHYDTVRTALLWTLEQGLGEAFTPEVQEAWDTVYGVVATTMKEAAASLSITTR